MARIDSDESEPQLLLVEGRNDKHVVWQICNRHPELPDFFISDRGDINAVMESIGPEILAADRQALGILVDTDDDPRSRWDEIAYQLRALASNPLRGLTRMDDHPRCCTARWRVADAGQQPRWRDRRIRREYDPGIRSSLAIVTRVYRRITLV